MFVLSILAALGLVLAALGIAGVTYRSVIDRTREFAVRLALGSQPAAVVRLVLRESGRDLAVGVAAGVAGGFAACAVLARVLENIAAVNATAAGLPIAIIVVTAFASAWLPALRITRVRPATVLRN